MGYNHQPAAGQLSISPFLPPFKTTYYNSRWIAASSWRLQYSGVCFKRDDGLIHIFFLFSNKVALLATIMWITHSILLCCMITVSLTIENKKCKEETRSKRNYQYSFLHAPNGASYGYRLERRISSGTNHPLYHTYFQSGPRPYAPYKGRPQKIPAPPYAVQMEPLVHYSQRDPLYDTNFLNADGQDDLLTETNHLSEKIAYGPPQHKQIIERPVYIKEPEPIIEIIIKESNVSLPTPPTEPPPPKKKEEVQVFYVKYKKNPHGHGKDSIIYEKPIPAISPPIHDEEEYQHKEVITATPPPPPPPSTTLRTIIKPDSEMYHSQSGIKVTFGKESFDYDKRASKQSEYNNERSSVQFPQGRQLSTFPNFPPPPPQRRPNFHQSPNFHNDGRQPQPYRPFNQFRTTQFGGGRQIAFPHQQYSTLPRFQQFPPPQQSQAPKFSSRPFPVRQPVPYQPFESLRTPQIQFRPQTHFPISQQLPLPQKPQVFNQFAHQNPVNYSPLSQTPQITYAQQQQPANLPSPDHQESGPSFQNFNQANRPDNQQNHLNFQSGSQEQTSNYQTIPQNHKNFQSIQNQPNSEFGQHRQNYQPVAQDLQNSQRPDDFNQNRPNYQDHQPNGHLFQRPDEHKQLPSLDFSQRPDDQRQFDFNQNRPNFQENQNQQRPEDQKQFEFSQHRPNYQPILQDISNQNYQRPDEQKHQHVIPPGGELIQALPKFEQHISLIESNGQQRPLTQTEYHQQIQHQFTQPQSTPTPTIDNYQFSQPPLYQTTPKPVNFVTTQKLTYKTQKQSYNTTPKPTSTTQRTTTKDPKTLTAQLPDEVPDDLRQQLLSSGILNNADISILDYDKVGDIPLSALPPDQLANFLNAGGGQQLAAARSEPIPAIVDKNGKTVELQDEQEEEAEATNIEEVTVKPDVQMKVVHYDPQSERGQQVLNTYLIEDGKRVDPVVLNDKKYNRYLPLKVSGTQFPIPDVVELKGKKISSVVVLAPVVYDFSQRKTRNTDNEIELIEAESLRNLLREPTNDNYKKFLDAENKTRTEKQSVILLVTDEPHSKQEIFMYDIFNQTVSKLNGELSTAFVKAAEANAAKKTSQTAASNIIETRIPYIGSQRKEISSSDTELENSDYVESRVPIIDPLAMKENQDLKVDGSEKLENFVDISGIPVELNDLTAAESIDSSVVYRKTVLP